MAGMRTREGCVQGQPGWRCRGRHRVAEFFVAWAVPAAQTWDANPTPSCWPTVLSCAKQKVKSRGKRRGCGGRAPGQFAGTKISKIIAEFHSLADGRKRPVPAGAEAHPQERRL